MAEEQKPHPSLLGLAFRREAAAPAQNESTMILSRTPSFRDWMNKRTISHTNRQSSVTFPTPPTSSPRPQNQMGQISVKNQEPWSSSTEIANPFGSLASARKDWAGANAFTNNKNQSHYSSYEKPAMVLFPSGSPKLQSNTPAKFPSTNMARFGLQHPNPGAQTMENRDQVKLLPKPGIPTKPRSGLKRKTIGTEQFQPHQSPSPSTSIMMKKSVDHLVCEICQVSCSGALTMEQHLNGRPHKAKLQWGKLKRNCTGDRKGKPRCDICQIWCSDRSGLGMHFKGQKHKAKLQELEFCRKNGVEKVSKTPILCELCQVSCMNEDLYKMHLKGKQHAIREELKQSGML